MSKINIKKYKYIIPLGFSCVVADQLKKNQLRKAAFPFDWIQTPIKSLYSILENNFDSFFDEKTINQIEGEQKHWVVFLNKIHKNKFYHEDNILADKEKGFQDAKDKYKRRIERFYGAISSKEPVLFIRFTQKDDNENITDLNNFLHKKFPDLEYFLLSIKEINKSDKLKKPAYPVQKGSNIKMYYINTPEKYDYYYDEKYDRDWSKLLLKIGLLDKREYLNIVVPIINRKIDASIGKVGIFLKAKAPNLYYLIKKIK